MKIKDIAEYYIAAPNYKIPTQVAREFSQFIVDLAQIELQGMSFQYVDFDPYFRGSELCLEDIYADFYQRKLMISTQGNNSELLGPEINMMFRCIHEMHHLQLNVGFGWEGEAATAIHIMSLTDKLLFKQILFSETLGQVAVRLHRGQFPEFQKVVLFEPEVVRCFSKC
ncbi:hypothetical protein [Lyngbya aestuarii]|uniref:hypothetical protein n=1 Tax=Lyngbya aestuarii TaxID=118322 RepID=UPI00403D7EEA